MIQLKDLTMAYRAEGQTLEVLSGADAQINQGESVAIIGPSGSGKTTLLLLLAGLEQAQSGEIFFEGRALSRYSADELADMRCDKLGIIFQSFHLVPSLNALGNVALPLEIAGQANARARAAAMLEKVGLTARQHHYPGQLSGGEQQRVAIARALVHSPRLVLADEPTGNLDIGTGERISDLLFKLNQEQGSTLVLVTHDEALAARCQRTLRLTQGQLMEDSSRVVPA